MSRGKLTIEQRQQQVITRLKNENAFLRIELKKRDDQIADLTEKLEKAMLHIEELQKYVFRGKTKSDDDKSKYAGGRSSGNGGGRNNSSYRRPVPALTSITEKESHPLENCPHCQTLLTKKKLLEFYEEDILPIVDWFKTLKKVKLIKITTGYCPKC